MRAKLRLLMAMLLFAAPVEATEENTKRLRHAVEQGLMKSDGDKAPAERLSLASRMAHYRVPGFSVAVLDGGDTVFADAFGEAQKGEPATPATIFQAASISKPVTAVAVMRLVEQGVLDLDTDIRRYLTSWSVPAGTQADDMSVTIRQILSHTAGFTVHGFRGYAPDEGVPTVIQILDGEPPANSAPIIVDQMPGKDWRYSGGGYTVLQILLEDVTGEPFAALMKRLVLDPFGMTRSTFEQPLDLTLQGFAAHAHTDTGKERDTHTYPELAAAGLWTTPGDLTKLFAGLMASYRGDGGLLTQASARTLATPVIEGMGPGFALDGEGDALRFSHGGSNAGFKSFIAFWPARGQGVAMMGNGDRAGELQRELFIGLSEHYDWP